MDGALIGFIIWAIFGGIMIGIGVSAFFSKKAVGFWTNVKPFPVKDVGKYNRATGKLFVLYGVIFTALGIPLVDGQNSPYIMFSVLGVMFETIGVMAIYSLVIMKKYRKDDPL